MKKCLIITGGEYSELPSPADFDLIIACDKGYEYAKRGNIVPDLIIGDFDSYEGELPSDAAVMRLKPEKDDTDTMFAVKYALEKGYDDITLVCSLGKRFDHTFANIQSGIYAAVHGACFSIIENDTKMYFLTKGSVICPKKDGHSLSLFSITDTCTGVSLSGAKYPLENAVLTSSFPLGVSNEWAENEARVSVNKGVLLVIISKKQ